MGSIGPIDLSAISRLSERWQRNISAMQYLGFREMWKWETNQADSLGSPGSVWGVPCASLLSNELSHTPYRKGKGEALALGKAEALAQRRELRTNQASYRKLHQSPRHWAPDHPGGRRWEKNSPQAAQNRHTTQTSCVPARTRADGLMSRQN